MSLNDPLLGVGTLLEQHSRPIRIALTRHHQSQYARLAEKQRPPQILFELSNTQ